MDRAAQARANHRLDRITCWTFASKLATVHPVAGQPRPVRHENEMNKKFRIHIGDLLIWRSWIIMGMFSLLFFIAFNLGITVSVVPTEDAQQALRRFAVTTIAGTAIFGLLAVRAFIKRKAKAEQ
jgi:Na+/melibiose symporter-like transporter